ncbi:MAG TPA: DUF2911 domain-containing protein [Thermoanaerobaculia bacterium]|nr:DUF2911 domain-containing protein [Thermoanaerobaculia bacterium]
MKRAPRSLALAALVAAVALLAPAVADAQDLHPSRRASPMGMARITLDDGTYVRVVYNRPYKRGRDNVFGTEESGALVPYGQLWRTGANEATEITVTGDVQVAGQTLPAGTYSLFTTPGADEWKVHFNSELGLSGTGRFNQETRQFESAYTPDKDVVTATATPTAIEGEDAEVDQFTISFEKTDAGADMILRWIRTEVRVPIAPAGE